MRPRSGGLTDRCRSTRPGSGRRQEGQALVEAAIVLPVLLALIWAILGFGRAYGSFLVVAAASRDGVRLAAIGGSSDQVRAAVAQVLAAGGLGEAASVSIDGLDARAGEAVRVAVAATVSNPVPVPGLPDPMPISAASVMRKE